MGKKIEKVRAAVEALKQGGGRPRYPEDIKSTVRGFLTKGADLSELVNQTGIGRGTLFAWSREVARKKFRAVKVTMEALEPLRVVLPNGVSIEGVSVDTLKAILASLP